MLSFQFVFFIIGLICSVPVIIWYYRRHAHPRFRPKIGEMAMVSLFAVLLSLGGSLLIGGLMDDPEQFRAEDAFSTMPSLPGESGSEQRSEEQSDRSDSSREKEGSNRESGGRGASGR